MREEPTRPVNPEFEFACERSADWPAVMLELMPFSAIALFFVGWSRDDASLWLLIVPLMLSGLGWLKIGRIGIGCLFGVFRAVALWGLAIVAFIAAWQALFCGWEGDPDCRGVAPGVTFLASLILLLAMAFGAPVVSAIMVARASREW